tara:strand:+ start:89 stop:403 length:315 start_codon:yes stop_codon:yes gene_type:complete
MIKQISWEKFESKISIDEEDDDSPSIMAVNPYGPNLNYDNFVLFIGHSNFSLTAILIYNACLVDGVEAIDPISRYRFRLAVGKLFVPKEVLDNIETVLLKEEDE